jgi:hypothetical protein
VTNKLVRNEQRKLTATYLNGIAIGVFGIGGFTPIIALAQGANPSLASFMVVIACFMGSVGLHYLARRTIGGLEE